MPRGPPRFIIPVKACPRPDRGRESRFRVKHGMTGKGGMTSGDTLLLAAGFLLVELIGCNQWVF